MCHLYCTSHIWASGWKLSGFMTCVAWITNIVMGTFSWRIPRRFRYPQHRNGNYCQRNYFIGDGVLSARRCDDRSGDYRRTPYRTRQTKWVPFSYKLQIKLLIYFAKIVSLNIPLMIVFGKSIYLRQKRITSKKRQIQNKNKKKSLTWS